MCEMRALITNELWVIDLKFEIQQLVDAARAVVMKRGARERTSRSLRRVYLNALTPFSAQLSQIHTNPFSRAKLTPRASPNFPSRSPDETYPVSFYRLTEFSYASLKATKLPFFLTRPLTF